LTPIDRFAGFLYRALNPDYARDPLSGRGAQLYGGRFNPKGTPALYASLSPMTALREANQVGTLQPTTLVAYDADVRPVFDSRDTGSLAGFDMSPRDLASVAWRDEMMTNGESETEKFCATPHRRRLRRTPRPLLRPGSLVHRPQSRALALGRRRADQPRSYRRRETSLLNLPASPTRLGQIIISRRSWGALSQ
jgi:RES domain-containing protein